ncbi:hypothetical protein Q6A49_19250 [Pseudomonas sp. 22-AL-CL-001]|uniref:hypothetical protein n=1 Tax=Pseudomonas alabamensis TaxID=3064349 RepID=UPI00271265E4|nr:hypothetical protein [Pseudomonas sp. 22-AL-CL-001]MDO7912668.1 hypothetical protein [Pseudomonas sp. 22-AL-CL-001]
MSLHSKQALLERLAQGGVMHDWGAIVAIGRTPLNDLLQQHFLAAFDDQRFILPFDDTFAVDETQTEFMTLSNVVLGPPQLSFEHATTTNANVTLNLPILTGHVLSKLHFAGRPPRLNYSMSVYESMGYRLSMRLPLEVKNTGVANQGRLIVDLAKAESPDCNLGGTAYANRVIGERFGKRILEHPNYRQTSVPLSLDFSDFGPLSAQAFTVRTQPHPQAGVEDTAHTGDGAVVLFCQLNVSVEPGTLPANPALFPYLIPDDTDARGALAFDATLLINSELNGLFDGFQNNLIDQVRMPNAFQVAGLEQHDPLDRVVFGRVGSSARSLLVTPLHSQLSAGQRQQFVLQAGGRQLAEPQAWSAESIQHTTGPADITSQGRYTAMPEGQARQVPQVVVVTNRHQGPAGEQRRNALIVESADPLAISPRVSSWVVGEGAITLYSDSASVTWSLPKDKPALGTLVDLSGGMASFEPFEPQDYVPEVLLQQIIARDDAGAEAQALVAIYAWSPTLTLEPDYVSEQDASGPVQFSIRDTVVSLEDGSTLDLSIPNAIRWEVFGEGTITQSGLYTPPPQRGAIASVIMADVDDRASGYALVELAERSTVPPTWRSLTAFELEARGAGECLANGMQQIEVLVTIETAMVGELEIPLSPTELSTLKFYDRISNVQLPFVDAEADGVLPHPGAAPWYVNLARNPFKYRGAPTADGSVQSDAAIRRKLFYLQSTVAGTVELYAKFTKDGGGEWDSRDHKSNFKVSSLAAPSFARSEYALTRQRVFNDPPPPTPQPGHPVEEFAFCDESIDYWTLSCTHLGVPVNFRTCTLSAASVVRWESEQMNETYFSYLAYAFNPIGEEAPTELTIDGRLLAMAKELDYHGLKADFIEGKSPGKGQLMISLHRVPDMPYWHDKMAKGSLHKQYRSTLDAPLQIELFDEDGNLHRLRVDFKSRSVIDSRNSLDFNLGA